MAAPATPEPKKGGFKNILVFAVLCGIAGAGGYFAPAFLLPHPPEEAKPAKKAANTKPAFVPFGDVVVNLAEERLTRYLRVQLILVVDAAAQRHGWVLVDVADFLAVLAV